MVESLNFFNIHLYKYVHYQLYIAVHDFKLEINIENFITYTIQQLKTKKCDNMWLFWALQRKKSFLRAKRVIFQVNAFICSFLLEIILLIATMDHFNRDKNTMH